MSTATCPNCGKPVRPGARFCGHCGYTIPAAPAQPPAAPPPPPPQAQPPAASVCPHCGKPVRPGAKFCNSCGKAISVEPVQPPAAAPAAQPPAPQAAAPKPTPAAAPPAAQAGRPTPLPGAVAPPAAAKAAPPPAKPKKRSRALVPAIVIVLLLGCTAVLVGGFVYMRYSGDPLNLLPKGTGTPLASPSTSPVVTTAVATTAVAPVATTAIPTVAAPATAKPTDTPLPSPTATVSDTLSAATATLQPTLAPLQAKIILEDDFSGGQLVNWVRWGAPKPTVTETGTDSWLYLKAVEDPSSSGLTSNDEKLVLNTPGLEIVFDARLDPVFPNAVMIFDWDPLEYVRSKERLAAGPIHVELRKDKILLEAPIQDKRCEARAVGGEYSRYKLKVTEGYGVQLFLAEQAEPACTLDFTGLGNLQGRISFSGSGFLTYVRVSAP